VAEAELEKPEESPRPETTGRTEELDTGEQGSDPAMAEGEGSPGRGGERNQNRGGHWGGVGAGAGVASGELEGGAGAYHAEPGGIVS
jgi:hypothetical protein